MAISINKMYIMHSVWWTQIKVVTQLFEQILRAISASALVMEWLLGSTQDSYETQVSRFRWSSPSA